MFLWGKVMVMPVEPKQQRESPLILVVDDDPTVRMLARAALEQEACIVEEAENGSEALSAFGRPENPT